MALVTQVNGTHSSSQGDNKLDITFFGSVGTTFLEFLKQWTKGVKPND
jgi:hypothetical protein